jgi:capsular polysaccharide transport system permease protein
MKLSPPIRPSEALRASPVGVTPGDRVRRAQAAARGMGAWQWFIVLVLLPTLLVGAYYALVAADQYETEARYLMRGRTAAPSMPSGGGGAGIFAAAAGLRSGAEEMRAVNEFMLSYDAITGLRRQLDLVEIWRRPEADLIARLWWSEPEAERLRRYFQRRVTVDFDIETGIATLRVLAFRPQDALDIADRLLAMSEELVNRFTARTSADSIRVAREELVIAERRVVAAREALTSFREREQALDPNREAVTAMENVARLEASLAQSRAELTERRSFMRPENPQMQVLTNRIAALVAQIAVERSRLTQGDDMVPQRLAAFERLSLEREFADKQLASATSSLETARADAQRQQVFLLRVVEPNLAQRALHPKGFFNTATVLIGLSILFAIGWLLIAGAREHAN